MLACPRDALYRDESGIVRRSELLCVGCRSCALACPFGVISDEFVRHVSPKCDLCVDRVRQGKEPRCVAACASGALSFGELAEPRGEGRTIGGRILSHSMLRRT